MEVQTCSRFVEDKEGWFLFLLSNKIGQFHALVLTTRQGGRVLSQLDVAQANIF